jgi:hypothetical protein
VETFDFNVWSSGLWMSTATGSSAAMAAAGGVVMDPTSSDLQYMVRQGHRKTGRHAWMAEDGWGTACVT